MTGEPSTFPVSSVRHIVGGIVEVFRPAEIAPIGAIGAKGKNLFALFREAQIGVDDGKGAFFFKLREDARREDVNAGKGEGLDWTRGRERDSSWTDTFPIGRPSVLQSLRASRRADRRMALLVEEQIARGLAVLDGQRGQRVVFRVIPHHTREIDGAEDIDVVDEEWVRRSGRRLAARMPRRRRTQEKTMRPFSGPRRCRAKPPRGRPRSSCRSFGSLSDNRRSSPRDGAR